MFDETKRARRIRLDRLWIVYLHSVPGFDTLALQGVEIVPMHLQECGKADLAAHTFTFLSAKARATVRSFQLKIVVTPRVEGFLQPCSLGTLDPADDRPRFM